MKSFYSPATTARRTVTLSFDRTTPRPQTDPTYLAGFRSDGTGCVRDVTCFENGARLLCAHNRKEGIVRVLPLSRKLMLSRSQQKVKVIRFSPLLQRATSSRRCVRRPTTTPDLGSTGDENRRLFERRSWRLPRRVRGERRACFFIRLSSVLPTLASFPQQLAATTLL